MQESASREASGKLARDRWCKFFTKKKWRTLWPRVIRSKPQSYGEALTEETIGQPLSREISELGMLTLCVKAEDHKA
ncbi:hypothetical protein [Nitrosospira sp. Nsp13]|uniref:hypothetical protein n=1 Tax=Nitrosospira sp. Nsp13 TaxID=1855332 RepID=UPI00088DC9A0|nr:hypothetical protein [Nitrosospira sp. Nsp13]SCY49363.1 hypothetical protein SAMN05216308_11343 [Nitrosospira sp. Nsp13]